MTRLRASLVSGEALAEVAREHEIGDAIRLGPGELKTGGFRRASILADTFEALVAAIYLDAGWSACRALVRELFGARVQASDGKVQKDAKTRLQELLQSHGLALPVYELVASEGEDHAKVFEVVGRVEPLGIREAGHGSSRRAAEQQAAEAALARVREHLQRPSPRDA